MITNKDDRKKNLLDTSSNKNNSLLSQRKETPKPTNTFHTRPIKDEVKKEARISKKNKSTTTRISYDTLYRLNSLVTMGIAESVNDLIENMLDNFESQLSIDEKRMHKSMIEVYSQKYY